MTAHALLGASGAHKWLHCTPSARLEETMPDSTSDYAAEGSLAHEIGELKLRKAFVEPMGPRAFTNKLKKLQEKPLYQDEMLKHTDTYLNYVSGVVHGYAAPPYIAIEKKLDYSAYAPEGFGTGDCIIIGGNVMYVIDFKYGKGVPVSAENNPQMKLYALGAILEYSILYNIEKVVMVIVQPRLDSISECDIYAGGLFHWAENVVKNAAEKAFKGLGEFVPGEHCRFCRAKSLCRARAEFNLSLEDFKQSKPPLISNEEVGEILQRAQDLAKWAKALEEYALSECLRGGEVPGWKAVEGRGSRQYANQDEAFKALMAGGIEEAVLYVRNPLTVPALEKVLGKKQYTELLFDAGHVKTEPGKPTLAPESDKREPIKPLNPEDIFKNESGGIKNE